MNQQKVSTEIGLRESRRRISVKTFLLFVTILHLRCPMYKKIQFDVTDLWIHNYIMIACLVSPGFLCGSVVKCLTRNTGVPGSSRTRSPGFFRGSVLGVDRLEPSLVLLEKPRKGTKNVNCRRDMTEILLKEA